MFHTLMTRSFIPGRFVRLLIHGALLVLVLLAGLVPTSRAASEGQGRQVFSPSPPQRLISLAPSVTEILYFLELGDRVVGVTKFSYYPPAAALKPKVGSYINLNVEQIISLSPDLVIGTVDGNKRTVVELLEQAGIPFFVVNPRNIREAIETVATLGRVCGIPEKARSLATGLNERVNKITEKTRSCKRPRVFLQINLRPIMTANRNTFLHDLIGLAGGINMAGDKSITYPKIGLEEVIKRKPEVIIISSMERGGRFEKARQEWLKWTSIPAVKNNRVHLIDSDLIDRPSPRIIDGLEAMVRIIHPEVEWEE